MCGAFDLSTRFVLSASQHYLKMCFEMEEHGIQGMAGAFVLVSQRMVRLLGTMDDSSAKEIEAAPPNDGAALRNESQASVEGDGVRWRRSREC